MSVEGNEAALRKGDRPGQQALVCVSPTPDPTWASYSGGRQAVVSHHGGDDRDAFS